MRVSTAGKCIGLGVLAVCTWWATSSIVAQNQTAKRRAKQSNSVVRGGAADGTTIPIARLGAAPASAPEGLSIPAAMVSAIRLDHHLETETWPGAVTVSTGAGIIESLPNSAFLWSLRAYRVPDRKVLFQHEYKTQVFRTPPGQEVHPTFRETIPLAPGRYTIQVNLHRIVGNFDLSKLADEETYRSTQVVSAYKEVLVTE